MNCVWEPFEDKFRCMYCGFIVPHNRFAKNCQGQLSPPVGSKISVDSEPIKIPNVFQRAKNFAGAVVNHVQGGFKHCSNEQKQDRFNICKSNQCGLFKTHGDGGICAHDDCGCYIRSNGKFMDKLSWAESKCPVGLWGPVEPKNTENPENGV